MDNIKMDLREIGCSGMEWMIGTSGGRARVNTVMNLRLSYNIGKLSS
jgi:hypothetical protein